MYPKTVAGWNPTAEYAELRVSFDSVISEAVRGEPVELLLTLNRAAQSPIEVEVVPLAGDGRSGEDFAIDGATVIFEPGETAKPVTVATMGSADHDGLVAFGLRPSSSSCAAAGARDLRLLRIRAQ